MRSGIYFILNNVTLKLYIGSAVYFARRKSEHFTRLAKNIHHNEHLQRAYNKYGKDAFDFIIIELLPIEQLYEKEAYYIAKHNAINEEFGYNKCEVGSGMTGRKHSLATIEKMKNARAKQVITEEQKDKISKTLTGRKLSDDRIAKAKAKRATPETKAKMSIARKARLAINPELSRKAANARWGNEDIEFKFLTPPINAKDYDL